MPVRDRLRWKTFWQDYPLNRLSRWGILLCSCTIGLTQGSSRMIGASRRISPLNFGVRYEYSTVPQEAHNLLGNFDPNVGLVQVGHQISSLYNPDHKNFGPRAGFAWDILGNGRTVLRGGGGLIYETVNWQSFVAFNNAFGPGSVPTGAPIDAAGSTSGGTITTGNVNFKYIPPADYPTPPTGIRRRLLLR